MIRLETDSPLSIKISFNKLIKAYEEQLNVEDELVKARAKQVIAIGDQYPELRNGFSDISLLKKYKTEIAYILKDSFPDFLTQNEIKAASIPFMDVAFNKTARFKKILEASGTDYQLQIRNLPEGHAYILACSIILKFHFKIDVDFTRPLYYDIPDADAIMKHYRILYNGDFLEIIPTDKAKEISEDDIDELLKNFDDLNLWKEKFPPNSWICKGFVISNIFDVTSDVSISELKSGLLSNDKRESENFIEGLETIFKSLFRIPDLHVGFVVYDKSVNGFKKVYGKGINSFLLKNEDNAVCKDHLCELSYDSILNKNEYYALPDIDKQFELNSEKFFYKNLKDQGYKSAIFAPISNGDELLGVLELVSKRKKELNSINANKLIDVMPFIVASVLRSKAEEENRMEAIIQQECTSIHKSVYWKFEEEAKRFIEENAKGNQTSFKEIVFNDVFPLYGQTDIKGSSDERNIAIQKDLMIQLSRLYTIFDEVLTVEPLAIYEEIQFRIKGFLNQIRKELLSHCEQSVTEFVNDEIHPILAHISDKNESLDALISSYKKGIDSNTGNVYEHRKNYDNSVTLINKKLAAILDKKQREAQQMFPHYFERYKTDGVEHNMYVGASMTNKGKYHTIYLNNLRLWQLSVMCEMENSYYNLKPELPIKLDVASMILVYNASLSIRFRMDEKRFDVDGTYNARYEIIKKRLDKSLVKGTDERLTQPGKIAIVYSQKKDEQEYMRYIKYLQSKKYFTKNIEIVELEGVQGVSGLKAIRAEVIYRKEGDYSKKTYTYEDLIKEFNISN